eukprot:753931-Hanusia_phi.AAC.3
MFMICLGSYASSLRAIKTIANIVKFAHPDEQKMISRLQTICRAEAFSIDRQALSMVYEMHNGDIRSCLNALQMLSRDGGHVDIAKLRTAGDCVRDCNMSSGLFDVWNATFKLAGKQEHKQGGCQHNFPKVKFTDPRMLKTSACLESLGDADVMQSYINQHQSYSLSPYLKIPCLKFHNLCAAPQWPSIEYPRASSEVCCVPAAEAEHEHHPAHPDVDEPGATKIRRSMRLSHRGDPGAECDSTAGHQSGMACNLKVTTTDGEQTNLHLLSTEHRQRIQDHASIMLTFGLRYRQQTQDNGKAELAMQP